jgi:hypothetical protein
VCARARERERALFVHVCYTIFFLNEKLEPG